MSSLENEKNRKKKKIENHFRFFTKDELIQKCMQQKSFQPYLDFLTFFKKDYINSLRNYYKHMNVIKYITNDKKKLLEENKSSQIDYLFYIKNNIPLAMSKIYMTNQNQDTKQKKKLLFSIKNFLHCQYNDIIYLFNTYVLPEHRGMGINKLMFQYMLHKLKKYHKKYVVITIHKDNIPSIKSYEKLGFIKTNIQTFDDFYYYYTL